MKKIIFAIPFFLIGLFATTNVAAQSPEPMNKDTAQIEKQITVVDAADLPEAITRALESDAYTDWSIEKAEKIQMASVVKYRIALINGENRKTVVFDHDGNPMD
jgi:hypothetical protein